MKFCQILLFVFFLLTDIAHVMANMAPPEESFARINQCAQKEDTVGCRELITASSVDVYDRFVSYGLMKCLPKNVTYFSQENKGNQVIIRASVTTGENKRFMRLVFVEEEGQWKLDVPESLHIGLGDKWEQQLNLTEQIYVVMQQQMGGQLNCSIIQNLANSKRS